MSMKIQLVKLKSKSKGLYIRMSYYFAKNLLIIKGRNTSNTFNRKKCMKKASCKIIKNFNF